jgi:hypothetical protein
MTAEFSTTCAGGEIVTPSENDTVPEWYARHVERVFAAANNGSFVVTGASRLYTTWPLVDPPPATYTHLSIRYNGPPPESDNDFLNRHLTEVPGEFTSHPPQP